jgi:hypothetical protein
MLGHLAAVLAQSTQTLQHHPMVHLPLALHSLQQVQRLQWLSVSRHSSQLTLGVRQQVSEQSMLTLQHFQQVLATALLLLN